MKLTFQFVLLIGLLTVITGCGGGSGGGGIVKIMPQVGPYCGNGVVDAGEQCDVGVGIEECEYGDVDCSKCGVSCEIVVASFCGDGVVDSLYSEQCDDGNKKNNDGCSVSCGIGFLVYFLEPYEDVGTSIIQTSDGGYAVAGRQERTGNGEFDAWIIKTDATGKFQWENVFGGTKNQRAQSIWQTSDGGYAVAGFTNSTGNGGYDMLILKLDSNGALEWQKTYGDSGNDVASSIEQTADGGYIVGGSANLSGSSDFWVLKLDSEGAKQWQNYFGRDSYDYGYTVTQTSDGGYIFVGESYSRTGANWLSDVLLVKMDSAGEKQWERMFGGSASDWGYSVIQSPDGGYVVAATTASLGEGGDAWISKFDSSGNYQWDKTYGGFGEELVYSIQNTSGGGYVFAGSNSSNSVGAYNFWVVRIDANGEELWEQTYGSNHFHDSATSVRQTTDGGFIVTGRTLTFGGLTTDLLIMKLDSDGNCNGCR